MRKSSADNQRREVDNRSKNPRLVSIAFCCNHPNTGRFTGKFSSVNIGDELLCLSNQYYPPKEPALAFEIKGERHGHGAGPRAVEGAVKISRRRFEIIGYKYGWGNWCWDLVIVRPEVAVDVINYLKELNCFTCEAGLVTLFDQFNDEGVKFEKDKKTLATLRKHGWQRP